jgi:hypothetical protein
MDYFDIGIIELELHYFCKAVFPIITQKSLLLKNPLKNATAFLELLKHISILKSRHF